MELLTGTNTYCLDDPTQIVLDGSNILNTRTVKIRGRPCIETSCLPEEEVLSTLDSETMWISIITNVKSFYPEDYSEETMIQNKLHSDRRLIAGG